MKATARLVGLAGTMVLAVGAILGWLSLPKPDSSDDPTPGNPPAPTPTVFMLYTLDGEPIESNRLRILGSAVPFQPWQPTGPSDVIEYVAKGLHGHQPWETAIARRVWESDYRIVLAGGVNAIIGTPRPSSGPIRWVAGFRWADPQPSTVLAGSAPRPPSDELTGFSEVVFLVSLAGSVKEVKTLDYFVGDSKGPVFEAEYSIEDFLQLPEAPLPTPTP